MEPQKSMTFELRLCPINKRTCRGSWNLVIMTLGYTSTNRTPIFLRKYYHRILKQDLSLRYIKAFIPRGSSLNFTFFFYLGFLSQPFMNHKTTGEDQGWLLFTTSICFTDTYSLVKQLLQKAHLCTQVGARLEPGTFGFQVQIANH